MRDAIDQGGGGGRRQYLPRGNGGLRKAGNQWNGEEGEEE